MNAAPKTLRHLSDLEEAGLTPARNRAALEKVAAQYAVAITPANYNFRYKASARHGDRLAYVFQITPRQKREGLIKGELWLDSESGAVVRETGHFVKSPSILVKRIEITRDFALPQDAPAARLTHITVTARLIGTAEFTVQERPCETSGAAPSSLGANPAAVSPLTSWFHSYHSLAN